MEILILLSGFIILFLCVVCSLMIHLKKYLSFLHDDKWFCFKAIEFRPEENFLHFQKSRHIFCVLIGVSIQRYPVIKIRRFDYSKMN